MGFGIGVVIAAGYALIGCASEVEYLVAGRDGYANVTTVRELCRSRRALFSPRCYQDVRFAFTEPDGTQRTGVGHRPTGWRPTGDRVAVRYTAGRNGRARLAGAVEWPAVVLGGVAVCAGAFLLARFAARGGLRSAVA